MTRDVLVSVSGIHMSGGEPQEVELITAGDYFLKNGKEYILFEETLEEGGQPVKTTIRLEEDSLDITRRGDSMDSRMKFQKGQKDVSRYLTPAGELMLGIHTNQVSITREETLLRAEVSYALEVNFEHMSDCNIVVTVKPRGF